jgi:nitrite reductase/ring-hydroxylating ferredoxin subunit
MVDICTLAALDDHAGVDFTLPDGRPAFVVGHGTCAVAYINACPHQRSRLNATPGRFFDWTGERLLCHRHGALFRVADGRCIDGPCLGKRLDPVPVVTRDGIVSLAEAGSAG